MQIQTCSQTFPPHRIAERGQFAAMLFSGKLVALFLSISMPASAQDAVQVENLKRILQAREHHAEVLLDELREIDQHVEARMENMVNALKVVGDSKDSRTKVARLKEDTMESLMKNIQLYNTRRQQIQEQIVRPTANLTDAQKQQIRKALDSRIEKRVAQIIELQKSMPAHEDYEKYKVLGGSGYWNSTIIKNEDWEQNQLVTRHTDLMRKKLQDELGRSVTRLEQQAARLKQQLQSNPAAEEMLKIEIQRNDELLTNRQAQLEQVLTEVPAATRPIGKGEAGALDDAVATANKGLSIEINRLFGQFNAYITFLPQLNAVAAQLNQIEKAADPAPNPQSSPSAASRP